MNRFALTLSALLLLCTPPPDALAKAFCMDGQEKPKEPDKDKKKTQCMEGKKPPRCDDCKTQTARIVHRYEEAAKIRALYRKPWIRAQAKQRAAAKGQLAGHEELECLIKEEYRKWRKNTGTGGTGKLAVQASVDSKTCEIQCLEELRKARCEWFSDATAAHETHHVKWCKNKSTPHAQWNAQCQPHFKKGGDPEKRRQCADQIIDDIADEEAAGADEGIAKLRRSLARFRKRCNTNTSMDDFILAHIKDDKNTLRKAFKILSSGVTP